jgi:hypothetical protein
MVFKAKQFYRRYKEQLLVNEDVNLKLASAQISIKVIGLLNIF